MVGPIQQKIKLSLPYWCILLDSNIITPNFAAKNQDSNVTNGAIDFTVNDNDFNENTKRMHMYTTPTNLKAITRF